MKPLDVVETIYDVIKEAGEDGIPSGHLYALLTGVMSLDTYQSIIDLLTESDKITCKGWLLKAVR